jgi:hypothetical protein
LSIFPSVRLDACLAGLSIDTTKTTTKSCVVKCKKDYQKAVFESDTSKYYVCRGGTAYEEQCETDQIFDGDTMSCVAKPATVN